MNSGSWLGLCPDTEQKTEPLMGGFPMPRTCGIWSVLVQSPPQGGALIRVWKILADLDPEAALLPPKQFQALRGGPGKEKGTGFLG